MHARTLLLVVSSAFMLVPSAWGMYKVIGPNGQVTFTDVPPSRPGDRIQQMGVPAQSGVAERSASPIPADLQPIVQRYPVVIYTTPQCQACADGVELLQQRGVPYVDKSISTLADVAAFKRISGGSDKLPLLSIGGVQLAVGFSPSGWNQALSAAGYPHQSHLPGGFAFAAPEPLAPPSSTGSTEPTARTDGGSASAGTSVLPPPNPKAPPGFQF